MLVHELSEPYPMTDVARSDTLDRIYQMSGTDSREQRRERLAWVIQAGGEVVC